MAYLKTPEIELQNAFEIATSTATTARPPPRLTVSEWADRYRRLSSEASAEPGQWTTSRAPYQREIMDSFNDTAIEQVVLMSSAQIGKSEIVLNVIAFFADQDPSPMLALQPTLEMAEAFSKDRLAPMIRDCPTLRKKFAKAGSKGSGNTLRHKIFPGGHITLAGANSPASLAMRPVRVVLADEVDRYPASAGTEGDPVSLAFKRTAAFWNRVHGMFSTPGDEGLSRIDAAFQESDQRLYMLPCPHCDSFHRLQWKNVKWDTDEDGEVGADVWMVCPDCGCVIEEKDKSRMLRRGRWEATKRFTGIAGFHLSELYSPWSTWRQVRNTFLRSKNSPERLKTWVNTSLGETWRQEEDAADMNALQNRREPYTQPPGTALVLTAGVDVQDDRLEIEVVGWGHDLESWGVDYRVLSGDPGKPELWKRLADMLSERWRRDDGVELHIASVGIDSGGHFTTQVYNFAGKFPGRVFALKGMAGAGRPIVSRPSRRNKGKIPLYTVGVDMVKELFFFSHLKTMTPGPGYCHFPSTYDETWYTQLTNERPIIKHKSGVPVRVWIAKGRNEALDCRVYAIAAVHILRPNFKAIERRQKPAEPKAKPKQETPASNASRRKKRASRKRGGYIQNW